jgi:hypothetical protein
VVLTTGYAGSRTTHILFLGPNMNINSPAACAGGPLATPGYTLGCGPGGVYQGVPYQNNPFLVVSAVADGGRAQYDSLQIKAETKSSRHGLYALFGYTWSRTFDTGMADGDGTTPGATYWPLPGTKRLDWGLSQLNLNDQFTASVLYNLPVGKGKRFGANWSGATNALLGGWQVNIIEKATSGFPVFVVDSNNGVFTGSQVNFQWNGSSLNRPNEVCNPKLSHPTLSQWFNTSCFVSAPAGELGTAPRAPVYGPRFVNTDFSLFKNFALTERYTLQFRSEFFNLFNHPQFGLIGTGTFMQDVSSPSSFGVVNQTVNDPRVIQFALRLDF